MTPSDSGLVELEREIQLRTDQAKERLDEMDILVKSYQKELEALIVPSSKNGRTYYKIPEMPDPPEEINLLASEVLHHLRSTLDNLIVGLASFCSKRTLSNDEEKQLSFPIYEKREPFDDFQKKNLKFLNSKYMDLLFRLQPIDMEHDRDEDYNGWVRTALGDCALYSNHDKHRRPLHVGQAVSGSRSAQGPGVVLPPITKGGVRTDEDFAWHETVPGHGEVNFLFTVYFLHPLSRKPTGISQALDQIYDAVQSEVIPMFFNDEE
jgi:hypothetical protein